MKIEVPSYAWPPAVLREWGGDFTHVDGTNTIFTFPDTYPGHPARLEGACSPWRRCLIVFGFILVWYEVISDGGEVRLITRLSDGDYPWVVICSDVGADGSIGLEFRVAFWDGVRGVGGIRAPDPGDEEVVEGLTDIFHLTHHVFALANCRNVVAVERDGVRRRHRDRKRLGRTFKYYTLSIDGMKPRKVTSRRAAPDEETSGRALHICRGHFATYTDEKPLFGKYAGRFWVPQHTRGSRTYGEVQKDYEVSDGEPSS